MIAWEMDARTRLFTRVSGRAESVLGYPVEHWRTVPGFWIGVLHPDDRERVAVAVWRALRTRDPCEIEYRAVASDGAVVRLRDKVRVVTDGAGAVRGLQGTIVDLTPPGLDPAVREPPPRRWRRGRHRAVRPASPVLTAPFPVAPPAPPPPPEPEPAEPGFAPGELLEGLGEAVLASDAEHRVVYWNEAAEKLLGWPAAEAIGRVDSELLDTRTDPGQTAEIIAGLLGRRPWSAEVVARSRDGHPIPVLATASALRRGDGEVAGYVAVVTDLREVRRGEVRRGAAAAMDAVARLAGGVARELNDGVARIEAAVRKALARVSPTDPTRAPLDDALGGVDETAALASQLMAVGRLATVRPATTDLGDVIRRSLPALRLLAGEGAEVVADLDPGIPAVRIDPAAVSQVVLNIAANSLAAMAAGGRLTLSTGEVSGAAPAGTGWPPGAYVFLEIRDAREPLSAEQLEHMFEPFHEAVPPGLGLAAAHGLVVRNGGAIAVENSPGGGLAFRVFLEPATARPPVPDTIGKSDAT